MWKIITHLLVTLSVSAHATCKLESTTMKFDGTAFAQVPFKITDANLEFFKNTKRAMSITYDPPRDQWCYHSNYKTKLRPEQGCFKRVGHSLALNGKKLKVFTLHDLKNHPVASVNVRGNELDLFFLLESGVKSGKRIRFAAPLNASQNLEVRAWNCPNENFLSCVGAQFQLKAGEGLKDVEAETVGEVEMSKRLGHFEASCEGLREIHKKEKGPIAGAFSSFDSNN